MVNKIESAVLQNKIALATILDIEGAFDKLNMDSAVRAMKDHKIDDNIIQWYSYYLRNRVSTVKYGLKRKERVLTRGTPQGGVLSPILWNLAFNSLLKMFDKGTVEICSYSDDACLITTAYHSAQTARKNMQHVVDWCMKWGEKQGLKFCPKETVVVLFHRKQDYSPPETLIKMNGSDVPYPDTVRYLGLHLDRALLWKFHFRKKIDSARALLFNMWNALGTTWGLKPYLIHWIYTGIVRPAKTYGSMTWAHSITHKGQLAKLRRLHGLALRMLCPKRKSTPVAGMKMMAFIPPLERSS